MENLQSVEKQERWSEDYQVNVFGVISAKRNDQQFEISSDDFPPRQDLADYVFHLGEIKYISGENKGREDKVWAIDGRKVTLRFPTTLVVQNGDHVELTATYVRKEIEYLRKRLTSVRKDLQLVDEKKKDLEAEVEVLESLIQQVTKT